jgi:hypothetical protein
MLSEYIILITLNSSTPLSNLILYTGSGGRLIEQPKTTQTPMNPRQRANRRQRRIAQETWSTYIPSEYDRDYLSDTFPTEQREIYLCNKRWPALI